MMRYNDTISMQLEPAFQRARCASIPLAQGLCSIMTADLKANDVSEVHSPPRAARGATELGLTEGWCLDVITQGED